MMELVERYLAELAAAQVGRAHCRDVGHFLERVQNFVRERYGVSRWCEVEGRQLEAFLSQAADTRTCRRRLPAQETLRAWASWLRGFGKWLEQGGLSLVNPAAGITAPPPNLPSPQVLSEADIIRLIETPDVATVLGLRDRTIMEVLYATGIRLTEAFWLDVYDADLTQGRLTVRHGKGGQPRSVPLTRHLCAWLERYLHQARPQLSAGSKGRPKPIAPTPALWVSADGTRWSRARLYESVRAYAQQAQVKATVHTFRHCCATHLLHHGADIRHIRRLLGHTSLEATQRYTQVTTQDLHRALKPHQ